MDRAVVTGGAGFIGSALVRALLNEGHRVHVIDNLSSGSLDNLEEVADQITVHEYDVADYARIAPVIAGARHVFHLAAVASVPKSIHEPQASHDANVNGTFNVLRAAVEGKAGRVMFAASSAAYGDSPEMPKREGQRPSPKSPYASQKVLGEYYMSNFAECFGLETVSLRFFNVFGPRQDPTSQYSGVLSIFMSHILQRQSPTIFGDGEQSRDFIYVEDIVRLLMSAAQAPAATVSGKVYNAGNGGRYTLNQVWDLLQKIAGISLPAKYGPERTADVRHSQADNSAAVHDLQYKQQFSLEEGLRHTLDWYPRQRAMTRDATFLRGDDGIYRCRALEQFSWLQHGFGTRHANPYAEVTLKQIHSAKVWNAQGLRDREGEGDALISNELNSSIGIRTADCVPILIVDVRNRAVAAIHAGWRGSAAEIVRLTVHELERSCGSKAIDLYAAIGPCIRECCYEVSTDVFERFRVASPQPPALNKGKWMLNLPAANQRQMIEAGVPQRQIFDSDLCTACRLDTFYSYRKEPHNPGRLLSAIMRVS